MAPKYLKTLLRFTKTSDTLSRYWLVYRLAYNGDVAAGQLAVFKARAKYPHLIHKGRASNAEHWQRNLRPPRLGISSFAGSSPSDEKAKNSRLSEVLAPRFRPAIFEREK
jgi:hypothetical protein